MKSVRRTNGGSALFLGVVLIVCARFSDLSAQTIQSFDNLEFSDQSDFKKHEARILAMANYILSHPVSESHNDKVALANIVKWMSGTPDHDFVIDKTVLDLTKNSENVLGLYMAATAKAALQGEKKNPAELKLISFQILLDYCADPANSVRANKEMKKALAARKNDKLKDYLKL